MGHRRPSGGYLTGQLSTCHLKRFGGIEGFTDAPTVPRVMRNVGEAETGREVEFAT